MDALITLNQSFRGQAMANVVGFSNVPEDATQLQELADDIRFSYVTHCIGSLSQEWSLNSITVAFLSGGNVSYSVEVGFTSGPLAGTSSTEELAHQTALLVSLIYVGPRPNRGRVYFPGQLKSSLDNGQFDSAALQSFEDVVQTWVDGVGGASQTSFLRIIGRPAANGGLYVSSPVTNVVGQPSPATQRRRRIGS